MRVEFRWEGAAFVGSEEVIDVRVSGRSTDCGPPCTIAAVYLGEPDFSRLRSYGDASGWVVYALADGVPVVVAAERFGSLSSPWRIVWRPEPGPDWMVSSKAPDALTGEVGAWWRWLDGLPPFREQQPTKLSALTESVFEPPE